MSSRPARACAAALALIAGGLALAAGPAAAQERDGGIVAELTVSGTVFDNFFQVAEESEKRSLYAGSVEGRISERRGALELFVEGSYVQYEDLGASPGGGVGLAVISSPHELRLRGSYQDDRPAFDLGEVVRTSDVAQLVASYAYRLSESWEVGVEGQFAAFRFDSVPENDSELYGIGGSLRWRGLGYDLSPEIGASLGSRAADDPDLENDRYRLYARLVSIPVDGLYLSARYRFRSREYTGEDPLGRNFGREDDGSQWTAAASYEATEWLAFELYYDRIDNDSSLPSRTFVSQFLTLGISLGT